jgi:hypothetical protein
MGEFYLTTTTKAMSWGNLGKITIPQVIGVKHWLVIALFVIGGILLFRWFGKKGL